MYHQTHLYYMVFNILYYMFWPFGHIKNIKSQKYSKEYSSDYFCDLVFLMMAKMS